MRRRGLQTVFLAVIVAIVLVFVAGAGAVGVPMLVRDINATDPGSTDSSPRATQVGAAVFFSANDYAGLELWKSDATPSGTVRVRDINPGAGGSNPLWLTNLTRMPDTFLDHGAQKSPDRRCILLSWYRDTKRR